MWNDEEYEKAMLYYLIFEKEEYVLDENDFVNDRNKKIIKAINELKAEKKEISILSIKTKIKSKQVLEYLMTLNEYVIGTMAEAVYSKLIELSKKRKLFKVLQNRTMEMTDCENIDILAQQTIKDINEIEKINEKEKSFVEKIIEAVEQIESTTKNKKDYSLYTGIQDLDDKTCGLHKQELTIIGARPRNWQDNTSITDSRKYSKQRSRNGNC